MLRMFLIMVAKSPQQFFIIVAADSATVFMKPTQTDGIHSLKSGHIWLNLFLIILIFDLKVYALN